MLSVRRVAPVEYFADRDNWTYLANGDGCDQLFSSRIWQKNWWEAFGPPNSLEPFFLVFERDGLIVARIAFTVRKVRIGALQFRSMELLGNIWRGPATFRSEYLGLQADASFAAQAYELLWDFLKNLCMWDQLVLLDLLSTSPLKKVLIQGSDPSWHVGILRDEVGYEIEILGSLDDYKSSLSSSTRRHMFGMRQRLASATDAHSLLTNSDGFEVLNDLHRARWGGALLSNGRSKFLHGLQRDLGTGAMNTSILTSAGQPISALLNVVAGNRTYNLQSGFDSTLAPHMSPQLLHWGLVVEREFMKSRRSTIDLLLGSGKSEAYKARIAKEGRRATSVRVVRNRGLAMLYRARDVIKRHMRAT